MNSKIYKIEDPAEVKISNVVQLFGLPNQPIFSIESPIEYRYDNLENPAISEKDLASLNPENYGLHQR